MLDLYHNAASTCSQKVRLVLEEKGLDWTSHAVDLIAGGQHDADYIKLNPNHVVPTLVHDGRAFIESTLINDYLDDVFDEIPMRPSDPSLRHAAGLWVKRVDGSVHPAAGVITFAMGPRTILLQQPKEVLERNLAAIPDPAARAKRRSVIEHGVEAPEFAGALNAFLDLIDAMESSLSQGAWLSGEGFGLADACVMPYVLRLAHLAMGPLLASEARPHVHDWYERVQALPSYRKAVTDVLPEAVVEFFRSSGKALWADIEPLTRR